jgi:hypothetical protein
MMSDGYITIVGAEERPALTRSGTAEIARVSERISVVELQRKFNEFIRSLESAFAVDRVDTAAGTFVLSEIQFSAELSASGEFKLLGTGVGIEAGSMLTFVLQRQDVG